MESKSLSVLMESKLGVPRRLERAGGSLENPYIYDGVARGLKSLAKEGWLVVVKEETVVDGDETLIDHITFVRRR